MFTSIPHTCHGDSIHVPLFCQECFVYVNEHFIVLKLQIFVKLGNRFTPNPRHYIVNKKIPLF